MNYPKLRRRKVRLFDFSKGLDASRSTNLYPERAATCFNFRYSDGALKDGEGIKKFSVLGDPPTFNGIEPEKVYYYKRYDYINECDDDRIII